MALDGKHLKVSLVAGGDLYRELPRILDRLQPLQAWGSLLSQNGRGHFRDGWGHLPAFDERDRHRNALPGNLQLTTIIAVNCKNGLVGQGGEGIGLPFASGSKLVQNKAKGLETKAFKGPEILGLAKLVISAN